MRQFHAIRSSSSDERIGEQTQRRLDATRCDTKARRLRYPSTCEDPLFDLIAVAASAATPAADVGILLTGLLLGVRHGIDWDHIAAITDITSTTAAAGMAEAAHVGQHETVPGPHHRHGGAPEIRSHDAGPGAAVASPSIATRPTVGATRVLSGQGDAIR